VNIHWDSVNQIGLHVVDLVNLWYNCKIRGAVLDQTERGGPGLVSKSVNVLTPTPPKKKLTGFGQIRWVFLGEVREARATLCPPLATPL